MIVLTSSVGQLNIILHFLQRNDAEETFLR